MVKKKEAQKQEKRERKISTQQSMLSTYSATCDKVNLHESVTHYLITYQL